MKIVVKSWNGTIERILVDDFPEGVSLEAVAIEFLELTPETRVEAFRIPIDQEPEEVERVYSKLETDKDDLTLPPFADCESNLKCRCVVKDGRIEAKNDEHTCPTCLTRDQLEVVEMKERMEGCQKKS